MKDNKKKVEAILYTTGKFLTIEEIAKFCGIGSLGYLKDLLEELKKDYGQRDCGLEILNEGNKWKLNIKKDFLYLTEKLLTDSELDRPTQETLAIIAYKQPAVQSDVIKIRGNKAYDHIKLLRELNFLNSEKFGRTRLLKLNQKFYDYFDVVKDSLKQKFEEVKKKFEEPNENKD
jgi:segregation and condensation protein B